MVQESKESFTKII